MFEESARVVTAGTPLLEIGDPADLEVVIEVLSRDGAADRPRRKGRAANNGAAANRCWAKGAAGRAGRFHQGLRSRRRGTARQCHRATCSRPPEQRRNLGDQFRVEARIIVWEADNALKVPAGALFRQADDWAAFVVVDGRAQLRPVKVGRSSGTETQMLEGLKDGEQVILNPAAGSGTASASTSPRFS